MNYCTLFDLNYLTRGLALIESIHRHNPGATIFVLAMDSDADRVLRAMALDNVHVISLVDFETENLKRVKSGRSRAEYCWTCTPSLILHAITHFQLEICTYVDADLYFWNDPDTLLHEMGDRSILLTEHRYTWYYDQTRRSGKYCVQFMTFRNTEDGLTALTWWRDRCLEWCFAVPEDGKFGDQKYLDDWTTRFKGVHVLSHVGGGVAPWNVQQYRLFRQPEGLFCEKNGSTRTPFIFYHFHYLRQYANYWDLDFYFISSNARRELYLPYIEALTSKQPLVEEILGRPLEIAVALPMVKWRHKLKKWTGFNLIQPPQKEV